MREDAAYRLENENGIPSPQLIFYPDIIRENTKKTIALAGGPQRLWPHIKTHKMAEMIDMQLSMGIERFKCATISEMELACSRGAKYVLLAYPLVGPNVGRFLDTAAKFPGTRCWAIGDSIAALQELDRAAGERGARVDWLCDVDMGMGRTGVRPEDLPDILREAESFKNLSFTGFHCYDGQNHQTSADERERAVEEQAARFERCAGAWLEGRAVIAGGSPTLPCHAKRGGAYLSPGTVFVWDCGYAKNHPDLPFVPGAVVLTRVVSHPGRGRFTLDCGCKAIASDPAGQRGYLLEGRGAQPLFQSEEHWTWRMPEGREDERPAIGEVMYVIPTHICPTVALYRAARTAVNGRAEGEWAVAARDRD